MSPRASNATKLQALRAKHGLRITDIAKLAGVTWPTAQSWDLAKTVPSSSDALRIIEGLKKQRISVGLADLVDPS